MHHGWLYCIRSAVLINFLVVLALAGIAYLLDWVAEHLSGAAFTATILLFIFTALTIIFTFACRG